MAKRGLILLLFVWGVLLLAPPFAPQTQRMRVPLSGRAPWPYPPLFSERELKQLTRKNPADGTLALAQFRSQNLTVDADYWRRFDALVERFPNDLGARRAKLIKATSGGLVRHVYQPIPKNLSPSDRDMKEFRQNWQSPAQRARLVEQARVGARQRPDDGFFPWMEAIASWNRDDESALRALQRAARCSQFDDGVMNDVRAQLQWKARLERLSWDEKLATMGAALLPHYAQMRDLQREVIWSGIERYRRGDKAGAYRRWKIGLEAAGAMRRAYSGGPHAGLIGLLVGEAMQQQLWNTVARELNAPANLSPNQPSKTWQLGAFQALARRDGQGTLADFAAREEADFQSRKINPSVNTTAYDNALGVSQTSTWLSLEVAWLERNVFWLSVAGGLCLLICLMWRHFSHAAWGEVSVGQIAFFGALWAGALAVATLKHVSPGLQVFYGPSDGGSTSIEPLTSFVEFFDAPALFWAAIVATGAASIALCYWQSAREDGRLQKQVLREGKRAAIGSSLWPTLAVLVWLLALAAAALLLNASGTDSQLLFITWVALTVLALALTSAQLARSSALSKSQQRLAMLCAICALTAFGLAALFGLSDNVPAAFASALLVLGSLAILIYLTVNSRDWRAKIPGALAVALQTLGGVAVVCSVALLLASLAALPVRARQNRIVNDYVAQGEIDWMKSQSSIRAARAE